MKKILIMGLPGSGKTYFAKVLKTYLEENATPIYAMSLAETSLGSSHLKAEVSWFNADEVRKKFNDWDFSKDGRIRQSLRMAEYAIKCKGDFVICDFVAPLPEMRENFKADWTIWMDTIEISRYDDTNKIFMPPEVYDFRITEQDAEKWVEFVGNHIMSNTKRPTFNFQKETVQMLGRYQPWHKGHRALFEEAVKKTGQVIIQIRDCQGWNGNNPFGFEQIKNSIKKDLDPLYQGQYEIMLVPNITEIVYGRDVGYKINMIELSKEIQSISATKIREKMKTNGLL